MLLSHYSDEEGEGEEAEADTLRRKPWGDSSTFCPVALHDHEVLWPGNQDFACRYRERLYYLSSEEAKDKFTTKPKPHLAYSDPLEVFSFVPWSINTA